MMDLLGRVQRCYDYIRALEEERKKIEAFQRELPLCLQLVTQAIESVRQQMGDDGRVNDGPVLEEFIPLKPSSTSASSEDRSEAEKSATTMAAAAGSDMKPDWLRSVQLWNQEPGTVIKVEKPKKPIAVSLKKMGGAFQPFERGKVRVTPPPAASAVLAATSTTSGGGGDGDGGDGSGGGGGGHHRKARRCWSAELHRRFLHALQQLGGSHVATPKQIRELMKVDGLTNDEVKSHLQKYRLHTRRPNPAVQSSSNNCPPAPQFVLVGGILVPPPDYAAAAAAAQPGNGACAPSSGIYAPVASLPSDLRLQQQQQQNGRQSQRSTTGPSSHSEGRCSGEEDSIGDDDDDNVANSNSPTTSASSQTTTSSPPF